MDSFKILINIQSRLFQIVFMTLFILSFVSQAYAANDTHQPGESWEQEIVPAAAFNNLTLTTFDITGLVEHGSDPASKEEMDQLFEQVEANPQGSSPIALINTIGANNNPHGASDFYLSKITGYITIPESGLYRFYIDGDDAIDLVIDGASVRGLDIQGRVGWWYGTHGSCVFPDTHDCTDANHVSSNQVFLEAGDHEITFRHEESLYEDNYRLFWEHDSQARIQSPAPGSTLSGSSVTFVWRPNIAFSSLPPWEFFAGSSEGAADYFTGGNTNSTTPNESISIEVTGLPTDGSTVYIRIRYQSFGTWKVIDATYTAASGGAHQPGESWDQEIVPAAAFNNLTLSTFDITGLVEHGSDPASKEEMDQLFEQVEANPQGSSPIALINTTGANNNPHGASDFYLSKITGYITIPESGFYRFYIDGDDAIDLVIDGASVRGLDIQGRVGWWYGTHGSCVFPDTHDCTDANHVSSNQVFLEAGDHKITFRHEESLYEDNYRLFWEHDSVHTP